MSGVSTSSTGSGLVPAVRYGDCGSKEWIDAIINGDVRKLMEFEPREEEVNDWWKYVIADAAQCGQIHIMEWAHKYYANFKSSAMPARSAAGGGQMESLRWLISKEYPVDWTVYKAAASRGDIKMLQYLVTVEESGGKTIIYPMISEEAASSGNVELCKWIHDRAVSINESSIASSDTKQYINPVFQPVKVGFKTTGIRFEWDSTLMYSFTAMYNRPLVAEWLYTQGYTWNNAAPSIARKHNNKDMYNWFIQHDEANERNYKLWKYGYN